MGFSQERRANAAARAAQPKKGLQPEKGKPAPTADWDEAIVRLRSILEGG